MKIQYFIDVTVLTQNFDESQRLMADVLTNMHGVANRRGEGRDGYYAIDLPGYREGQDRSLGKTFRIFAEKTDHLTFVKDAVAARMGSSVNITEPVHILKDMIRGYRQIKKFNIPRPGSFSKRPVEEQLAARTKRMTSANDLPYFIDRTGGRMRSTHIKMTTATVEAQANDDLDISPNSYGLAALRPDDKHSDFWVPIL